MAVQRDRAVLIGRSPSGPKGRMLTFLTSESGKIRVYYRRFPGRRRREFLDLLQVGELLFTPTTERAPARLASFDCEDVWPAIRGDFDRLVHALHFAELTNLFTAEGEAVPGIFTLFTHFLSCLEGGGEPLTLRIVFELRLLRDSGFAPSLEECCSCRRPVSAREAVFSQPGEGIICPACAGEREGAARRISAGALTVMRKALSLTPDKVTRLRAGRKKGGEIRPVVDEMIALACDLRPRSSGFLSRVQTPPERR
jgi:DNA repair protein RecO (recombination protein O)